MAVTTERLVMLIEAQNKDVSRKIDQVERQLRKMGSTGESSINQVNQAMKKSADHVNRFGSSFSGVGAQFQDIGVSIAGGMNPGLVALQQGTQIAGQLQAAMQGGASATQVLKSAFASLVSPVALVSIAATAIAGIGLQYLFNAWASESEDAADSVKILSQSMERLKELGLEVSEISLSDFLSFSQVNRRVEVELDRLRSLASGAQAQIVEQFSTQGSLVGGSTIFDELTAAADDAFDVLERTANRSRAALVEGIKAAAEQYGEAKISAEDFEAVVTRNITQLRELGVSIPPSTVDTLLRMTDSAVGLQRQIDKITLAQAEKEAKAVLRQLEAMERNWRANVLVNFSMTGDVRKISELLGAIGAPKGLTDAAFNAESYDMKLTGAYRAMHEGRSSPYIENLNAQYVLRDAKMEEERRKKEELERKKRQEEEKRKRDAERKSNQVDSAQRVIEMLELESAKIGETALQQRIMTEQRRAGAKATETQKQRIAELVTEIDRQNEAEKGLKFVMDTAQQAITSQFSAITAQIKTGNDALDQFIRTLAEAAFQAALFNSGPLAGLFGGGGGGGGGGLSGLAGLTKIFGGFFANGGNLGAGKWGIAGENGPEIIRGPATVVPMRSNDNRGGQVVNIAIDATGADAAGLARVEAQLSRLERSFDKRAVGAVNQQRSRGYVG